MENKRGWRKCTYNIFQILLNSCQRDKIVNLVKIFLFLVIKHKIGKTENDEKPQSKIIT